MLAAALLLASPALAQDKPAPKGDAVVTGTRDKQVEKARRKQIERFVGALTPQRDGRQIAR